MTRTRGFLLALAAYVVALLASAWLLSGGRLDASPWRFAVVLLPLAPAAAIAVGGVGRYRRMDELEQRIHLMALAIAFTGTVVTTFAWGFLEGVGLPPMGGFGAFAVLVSTYVLGLLWARSRYR